MKIQHEIYPRGVAKLVKSLFKEFPVVVLIGARQVGKSTLFETCFPKIKRVVFDPLVDVAGAKADADLFLNNHPAPLFLDEIQYVPEIVPALKRKLDQDRRPGQYLLTGSQQWEVMKLLSESLAGRAVLLNLHPFSVSEITGQKFWLGDWLQQKKTKRLPQKEKPTLYQQIWRGFLPEAQFLSSKAIPYFYESYIKTYIEKDARQMADISDWQMFGRFYKLCASLTAQEINHSQIGRDIGLSSVTSKRWLDILQATFQWFEIPAFSQNTTKRLSLKSKGYLFDTGLVCQALAISSPEAVGTHPAWGALFETLVVNEIRKQCSFLNPAPHLYHWRVHNGSEVDLLLEYNGTFYPIEIKSSTHPDKSAARGIAIFKETYPRLKVAPGLILAPVDSSYAIAEDVFVRAWDG